MTKIKDFHFQFQLSISSSVSKYKFNLNFFAFQFLHFPKLTFLLSKTISEMFLYTVIRAMTAISIIFPENLGGLIGHDHHVLNFFYVKAEIQY